MHKGKYSVSSTFSTAILNETFCDPESDLFRLRGAIKQNTLIIILSVPVCKCWGRHPFMSFTL